MKENRTFRTPFLTWGVFALFLATFALTLECFFFMESLADTFWALISIFYSISVRLAVVLYPVIGICVVYDLPIEIRTLRSVHEARRFFQIVLYFILFLFLVGNPITIGLFQFIDANGFYDGLFGVLIPVLWGMAILLIAAIHITLASILIYLMSGNEEPRAVGWGIVSCVLLDITLLFVLFFALFFRGG